MLLWMSRSLKAASLNCSAAIRQNEGEEAGNEYKLDKVALKNEDDCDDDVILQPSSNLKTFLT